MAILSTLITLVTAPFLIASSLFLLPFAILTTTLAFYGLAFRVSLVYLELFFALIADWLHPPPQAPDDQSKHSPLPTPDQPQDQSTLQAYRTRRGSNASLRGPPTPRPLDQGELSRTASLRDFEGLGGWMPAEENRIQHWLDFNARLELLTPTFPSSPQQQSKSSGPRHHYRASTGGLQSGTNNGRPVLHRRATPSEGQLRHAIEGFTLTQAYDAGPENRLLARRSEEMARTNAHDAHAMSQSSMNVGRLRRKSPPG